MKRKCLACGRDTESRWQVCYRAECNQGSGSVLPARGRISVLCVSSLARQNSPVQKRVCPWETVFR
jgi:hypothetical protein